MVNKMKLLKRFFMILICIFTLNIILASEKKEDLKEFKKLESDNIFIIEKNPKDGYKLTEKSYKLVRDTINNLEVDTRLSGLEQKTSPITVSGSVFSVATANSSFLNVTGSAFVKSGGFNTQFLKADGSVDSTAYLPLAGGSVTGTLTSSTSTLEKEAQFFLSEQFLTSCLQQHHNPNSL